MKRSLLIWTLGVQLGALAGGAAAQEAPAPAPEVARLLRDSRAPARFRDHKPQFDIRPRTFKFRAGSRDFEETYYAVVDGSRLVALCDPNSRQVEILAPTPDLAPDNLTLSMPLAAGGGAGTRLEPQIRVSGRTLEIEQYDCNFSKEEAAAVIVFRQEWSQPRKGHSTSIFRFRFDPVRGYVVEVGTQVTLSPDPAKKNSASEILGVLAMQPAQMDNPWPGACDYDRTAYTSRGGNLAGWWNNLATAARVHGRDDFLPLREGGFLTYLGRKGAWIPAISYPDTTGAPPLHRLDPVTLQQLCYLVRPESEGSKTGDPLISRIEFTPLPPEAADWLTQKVDMGKWGSQRAVMLRLGRTEDLEDQPISIGTADRALVSPLFQLSTKEAHSGKNSLIVLGTPANRRAGAKPQIFAPSLPLEANTRYRVAAWVKVGSGLTEGRISVALHASPDLKDEEARVLRTGGVKTGEGWKQVTLEFETGPARFYADLRFQAIGNGAVYFDDFSFTRVTP